MPGDMATKGSIQRNHHGRECFLPTDASLSVDRSNPIYYPRPHDKKTKCGFFVTLVWDIAIESRYTDDTEWKKGRKRSKKYDTVYLTSKEASASLIR